MGGGGDKAMYTDSSLWASSLKLDAVVRPTTKRFIYECSVPKCECAYIHVKLMLSLVLRILQYEIVLQF